MGSRPSYHCTHFVTVSVQLYLQFDSTNIRFRIYKFDRLFTLLTQPCPRLQVPAVRGAAPPSTSTLWKSTAYQLKPRGSPLKRHSRLVVQSSMPHLLHATSARRPPGINPPKATRSTRRSRSSTTQRQTARCQALMVQQPRDGTPTVLPSFILRGTVRIITPR